MDLVRQLLAVGAVFSALALAFWWLRRSGIVSPRRGTARRIEVIERLSLGPQHSIQLVRADGRILLIATHPGGCTVLDGRSETCPTGGVR